MVKKVVKKKSLDGTIDWDAARLQAKPFVMDVAADVARKINKAAHTGEHTPEGFRYPAQWLLELVIEELQSRV